MIRWRDGCTISGTRVSKELNLSSKKFLSFATSLKIFSCNNFLLLLLQSLISPDINPWRRPSFILAISSPSPLSPFPSPSPFATSYFFHFHSLIIFPLLLQLFSPPLLQSLLLPMNQPLFLHLLLLPIHLTLHLQFLIVLLLPLHLSFSNSISILV